MNTLQCCRQLKYLLLSRLWSGTGSVVFPSGSVKITPSLTDTIKKTGMRVPLAIIAPSEAQVDPDHSEEPDLLRQSIRIAIMTAIPGDQVGENALVGANIPDTTKSEGKGLLAIEGELFSAIELLNTDNGIVLQHSASGASIPVVDPDLGYVQYRDYTFTLWTTADSFYHMGYKLAATGGSGQVALTWGLPPDRFDRFKVILRRLAGATAPSTATSGTGVTLSGNLATSVTDSALSAGTYSYSLFAAYDEVNSRDRGLTPSAISAYSAALTSTGVTVT